jgi:hypothetical protein
MTDEVWVTECGWVIELPPERGVLSRPGTSNHGVGGGGAYGMWGFTTSPIASEELLKALRSPFITVNEARAYVGLPGLTDG